MFMYLAFLYDVDFLFALPTTGATAVASKTLSTAAQQQVSDVMLHPNAYGTAVRRLDESRSCGKRIPGTWYVIVQQV